MHPRGVHRHHSCPDHPKFHSQPGLFSRTSDPDIRRLQHDHPKMPSAGGAGLWPTTSRTVCHVASLPANLTLLSTLNLRPKATRSSSSRPLPKSLARRLGALSPRALPGALPAPLRASLPLHGGPHGTPLLRDAKPHPAPDASLSSSSVQLSVPQPLPLQLHTPSFCPPMHYTLRPVGLTLMRPRPRPPLFTPRGSPWVPVPRGSLRHRPPSDRAALPTAGW